MGSKDISLNQSGIEQTDAEIHLLKNISTAQIVVQNNTQLLMKGQNP